MNLNAHCLEYISLRGHRNKISLVVSCVSMSQVTLLAMSCVVRVESLCRSEISPTYPGTEEPVSYLLFI